jgi:hypothetical protein
LVEPGSSVRLLKRGNLSPSFHFERQDFVRSSWTGLPKK